MQSSVAETNEASLLLKGLYLSPPKFCNAIQLYTQRLARLEANFPDDVNHRTRKLILESSALTSIEFFFRATRKSDFNLTSRYMLIGRCLEVSGEDISLSMAQRTRAIFKFIWGSIFQLPLFLVATQLGRFK